MNFGEKLRENALAIAPVVGLVLLLNWTLIPLPSGLFQAFILASLLLLFGLSLFLVGTDIGVLPMGEMIGTKLSEMHKTGQLLFYAALIGFSITLAEPDLQVLAREIQGLKPELRAMEILLGVSAGAGLFVLLGLLRILMGRSLKIYLALPYALMFGLVLLVPEELVPMSFDAGGVTTGAMTVPFIMALGLGVARALRHRKADGKHQEDSFGLLSFMSLGPIVALLLLGLFRAGASSGQSVHVSSGSSEQQLLAQEVLKIFAQALPEVAWEMALAILPLFLLFIFFQWKSLKLPRQRFGQMCVGILYTYVGLVVFLLGVSVAFSSVGYYLGQELAAREEPLLLLGLGLLLGAVIVFAEPSVWVLTRTVEEATDASVSRGLLLTCLASAVAVGVALSFARAYWDFSLIYLIVPAYVLAFALMPFTPDPFTGIAFDSGGVASGVLAATFIMPLALGVGESRLLGQASQAFGSVAMIAVAPLICIQLMGLYYRVQQRRIQSLPPGLSQMPEEQLSAGQPGWEQELADFYHCFRQAGDGQTRGGN